MKATSMFICLIFWLIIAPGITISSELPTVLENGFAKYAEAGPKEAIAVWTKNGALEGSKEALSQANNFIKIEDFYGKYIGYEFVKSNQISKSTSVYLINIKYEKGNLFSTFYCYTLQNGQTVMNTFNFHTNATAVWPASVIYGIEEK